MNKQDLPHVVVLGAGPAGVGAAYRLASTGKARVTVIEQRDTVGGNAGSFDLDGIRCDYGSHRLHPVVAPEIMEDLRRLLGPDLLYQTRHGRILLRGCWIHFPLKPLDLLLRLDKSFALGIAADMARKALPRKSVQPETFASILERGLGRTICRDFYFPFARKLWGVEPEVLAPAAAQRRVSGSSIGKMLRKVMKQIPGLKPESAGRFYYMRRGYGQISEVYCDAARAAGAEVHFSASFSGLLRENGRGMRVRYRQNGEERELAADAVWSTIPVTYLMRGMQPEPPREVLASAGQIAFRGMILIYLVLEQDRFSNFDAYYFPEESIPVTRISEPKIFRSATEPRGRTVLCAELPSDPGCPEWDLSDEELGRRLLEWMARAGLPKPGRLLQVMTKRLRQAYPVYRRGYEEHFGAIDQWLGAQEGILTLGRQGLFAHDNTHHTLEMAYAAVECLAPDGSFNRALWNQYRKEFETHVVED